MISSNESLSGITNQWVTSHADGLRTFIPQTIQTFPTRDIEGLNMQVFEPSETRACFVNGFVAREFGVPEGYKIAHQGNLVQFDPITGAYLQVRSEHTFLYTHDVNGEMRIIDFFAAQMFAEKALKIRRGSANKYLLDMATGMNARNAVIDLGNGIVVLHGTVSELQRTFGLEHMTHQQFFEKYGSDGVVVPGNIPNMPTGLSGQQSGHRR